MSEWGTASLGQLIELAYGAALADEDRSGSDYPVFGSNGIVGYHDQPLVAGPGIVVGRKGSVGALAWSDRDFWPIDTTYWVNAGRGLDLRWVYEAMKLCGLQHLSSSTGVPGLNREDAYERLVQVPPVGEQRRIAEILDTIDEAIQATERVITKLELTRSGMREHLCATNEWDAATTTLAGLVEAIVDCPHSTPEYQSNGVLVARTMHIKDGRFLVRDASRVSEHVYRRRVDRMVPSVGDIVLTREAPVGEAFAVPNGMRVCLGQRVVLIRPGPELLGQYLVELIYSNQGQRQIGRLVAGTTNPHLNVDEINHLAFVVPPRHEQRGAIRSLGAIDSRLEAEAQELQKLHRIRCGLAADLLSGRVRTVSA